MPAGRYLIVDGHSMIFAWPELMKLHRRRSAPARERLIKCLRDYQDWTGVRVVVVFDGKGSTVSNSADPGDIQIFYSARGQTADSVVERLASKYASQFDVTVATSDALERETVTASGAETISAEMLRSLIGELRDQRR
ncbi:MAG: NYN domain-containing protein [Chthoniobacterales bacterium]